MGFLFPSDFMHLWVKNSVGNFPDGSVAATSPSNAGSVDLIPGWRAKSPHAVGLGQTNKERVIG